MQFNRETNADMLVLLLLTTWSPVGDQPRVSARSMPLSLIR